MAEEKTEKSNIPTSHPSESAIKSYSAMQEVFLNIMNNLETARKSSTITLFEKSIKHCLLLFDECPIERRHFIIQKLFNAESFSETLHKIMLQTLPSEFTNRDYFSYDESDFKGQSDKTKCVMEFLVELLCGVKLSSDDIAYQTDNEGKSVNGCDGNQQMSANVVRQQLTTYLPHMLLMIAGNAKKSLWSSQRCEELSLKLLECTLSLYGSDDLSDILQLEVCVNTKDNSLKKAGKTLLSDLLHKFEIPLSRERWERNPFLCEAFSWLMMHLTSSQLSLHMNQILAVALNFLHNFDANYKLKGLQILSHLICSGGKEEIRSYNRAEVIYEALKTQIYSKDGAVLDSVIACIFSILKILEKPQDTMERHNFILSTLLTNAEAEDLLSLRRIYISHISEFVFSCDALCVAHLGKILKVTELYLEVDDGLEESARFSALKVLQNVLKVTWPRISFHSETILKFVLKFVININSPSFVQNKGNNLKEELELKVISCLLLLSKINPSVRTCFEVLRNESDHQGYLDDILKRLLT